jgi:hypothetical protein
VKSELSVFDDTLGIEIQRLKEKRRMIPEQRVSWVSNGRAVRCARVRTVIRTNEDAGKKVLLPTTLVFISKYLIYPNK